MSTVSLMDSMLVSVSLTKRVNVFIMSLQFESNVVFIKPISAIQVQSTTLSYMYNEKVW